MNPVILFYTKLGSSLLAAGVWIGFVLTGHDKTQQELEVILACKGFVVGMITHLLSVGAPKKEITPTLTSLVSVDKPKEN